MKNLLLIILFFHCFIFVHAQNDTIFPNVSGSWNVKSWTYGASDIIYSGYSCKILEGEEDTLGNLWQRVVNGEDDSFLGLIRSDSGKVYYHGVNTVYFGLGHFYDGDSTVVLYDFNLTVGDTIDLYYEMIVDSITTSDFLGVSKRKFYLSNHMEGVSDVWIEGMGSIEGLFRPVTNMFELGLILCNYTGNYEDSLGTPYTLMYDNPATCEELSIENPTVPIQVKILNNKINVVLEEPKLVQIYSLSGQLLYSKMAFEGLNHISLSPFPSGIYIVRVGNNFHEKFIVTE